MHKFFMACMINILIAIVIFTFVPRLDCISTLVGMVWIIVSMLIFNLIDEE